MQIQHVYYFEVNILCMILLTIVLAKIQQNKTNFSAPQLVLRKLILAIFILCLSDMAAILCRGAFFPGARILIQISNLIFLWIMPVISFLWMLYVIRRIELPLDRRKELLLVTPLLLFTVIALSNPFTSFLFSVNEQNLYARGPGVLIHWIISWFYLIYAGVLSIKAYRSTSNWALKNEYRPLTLFLILPAIGCGTQMLFYGVTSVQAGITLSIVMVTMQFQDNQITSDELTGINNRKAMRYFADSVIHRGIPTDLTVMMIDINEFKKINDNLGHAVGDVVLREIARLLRSVCGRCKERVFLCRYGGDEFVILGQNLSEEETKNLSNMIRQSVAEASEERRIPIPLDVSIGCAHGVCESIEDFEHYLRMADDFMYEDKKKR